MSIIPSKQRHHPHDHPDHPGHDQSFVSQLIETWQYRNLALYKKTINVLTVESVFSSNIDRRNR